MRLAITIEGDQNSGKSSTIKGMINIYGNKSISIMRKGWQRLYLNKDFRYLKLDVYCVPASPSETDFPLQERFSELIPEVLIVALQPNGHLYEDSCDFLKSYGYTVLSYQVPDKQAGKEWERFDTTSKETKLAQRADTLIKDIRKFIRHNRLV